MLVMGWIVPLPHSYAEALIPNVTVFIVGAFKQVIKVKWGSKGGALVR